MLSQSKCRCVFQRCCRPRVLVRPPSGSAATAAASCSRRRPSGSVADVKKSCAPAPPEAAIANASGRLCGSARLGSTTDCFRSVGGRELRMLCIATSVFDCFSATAPASASGWTGTEGFTLRTAVSASPPLARPGSPQPQAAASATIHTCSRPRATSGYLLATLARSSPCQSIVPSPPMQATNGSSVT